jgi:hypothetical protein
MPVPPLAEVEKSAEFRGDEPFGSNGESSLKIFLNGRR